MLLDTGLGPKAIADHFCLSPFHLETSCLQILIYVSLCTNTNTLQGKFLQVEGPEHKVNMLFQPILLRTKFYLMTLRWEFRVCSICEKNIRQNAKLEIHKDSAFCHYFYHCVLGIDIRTLKLANQHFPGK